MIFKMLDARQWSTVIPDTENKYYNCPSSLLWEFPVLEPGRGTHAQPGRFSKLRRLSWESEEIKATRICKTVTKRRVAQRELQRSAEGFPEVFIRTLNSPRVPGYYQRQGKEPPKELEEIYLTHIGDGVCSYQQHWKTS